MTDRVIHYLLTVAFNTYLLTKARIYIEFTTRTPGSSCLDCTEHEAGAYDVDRAEQHHRDVAGRAVLMLLGGGGGAVGGPAAAKVREQRPRDERPQGAAQEGGDSPHALG